MKDCVVTVVTVPKYVEYECPYCEEEIERYYDEFCHENGFPPEWDGELIKCPHCEKKIIIDGVNWD